MTTLPEALRLAEGRAAPTIAELIDRSSIGQALQDIKERGIDAHLNTVEHETRRRRKRSK